jgi:hypothetical protein
LVFTPQEKKAMTHLSEHLENCSDCWTNPETGYLELCIIGQKAQRMDEAEDEGSELGREVGQP